MTVIVTERAIKRSMIDMCLKKGRPLLSDREFKALIEKYCALGYLVQAEGGYYVTEASIDLWRNHIGKS